MNGTLRIRRVYLPPAAEDGARVLADRLWPRGVSKEKAAAALWAKDAAPADELRRWYGHEPDRFPEFARRYAAQLDGSAAAAQLAAQCRVWLERGNVTLLYAAKDGARSNAAVLKDWLCARLAGAEPEPMNQNMPNTED